jgi:hypothetical protein
MRPAALALIVLTMLLLLVGGGRWRLRSRRLPRLLQCWRPRAPDDCALCLLAATDAPAPALPTVRPWREGRSRRGAPRRVSTAGYACRRPGCPYQGITDAAVHALVADGHHGQSDSIQDFRCEACGSKASARWGTALYQL